MAKTVLSILVVDEPSEELDPEAQGLRGVGLYSKSRANSSAYRR